jgi:hypothetical protein
MNDQFLTREAPVIAIPERVVVLENLSVLRLEWEAAADGGSLINVSASVGLLLFDLTTKLGLSPEEQSIVLGGRLYNEATLKSERESVR